MLIWNWWCYAYPLAFMGLGAMLQEWFGHDSGIAVLAISILLGFRLQQRK